MPTVVIPREAKNVPCPNCGRVLRNLATLGIKRQVACLCGMAVVVERRDTISPSVTAELERRKSVAAA